MADYKNSHPVAGVKRKHGNLFEIGQGRKFSQFNVLALCQGLESLRDDCRLLRRQWHRLATNDRTKNTNTRQTVNKWLNTAVRFIMKK